MSGKGKGKGKQRQQTSGQTGPQNSNRTDLAIRGRNDNNTQPAPSSSSSKHIEGTTADPARSPSEAQPAGKASGGIYQWSDRSSARLDKDITSHEAKNLNATKGKVFVIAEKEKTVPPGSGKGNEGKVVLTVPGRPGYGEGGMDVVLHTNYLQINLAKTRTEDQVIYHRYDVFLAPADRDKSRGEKRGMFQAILQDLNTIEYATDYATFIVTTTKLDRIPDTGSPLEIELPYPNPNPTRDGNFTFTITYVKAYPLTEMFNAMIKAPVNKAASDDHSAMIQMLNVIMLKAPNMEANVAVTAQNKCFPYPVHGWTGPSLVDSKDLGIGLQALRGYFSSVRPTVGRLLLNLNVCTGIYYKPQPLVMAMNEIRELTEPEQAAFIQLLKVRVDIPNEKGQVNLSNSVIRTISGFAEGNSRATFGTISGFTEGDSRDTFAFRHRDTTPLAFYKSQHGYTIQKPDLPLLVVGKDDNKEYILQELCTIIPGQQYRRLIPSSKPASEMIEFSVRFPNLNAMSIVGDESAAGNGVRLLKLAAPDNTDPQADWVKRFGFSVDTKLITVPARVVPRPTVMYKKDAQMAPGGWKYNWEPFSVPAKLGTWRAVIVNDRSSPNVEVLLREFESNLEKCGMMRDSVRKPTTTLSLGEKPKEIDQALDTFFKAATVDKLNLVLVLLPQREQLQYARIKFFGDVKYGIMTQCCVLKKLQRKRKSNDPAGSPLGDTAVFGNLAIKMNIKLGGTNHSIKDLFKAPLDQETMIVGIDVTHPSPGSAEGAPSIRCVVASTSSSLGQWPGSIIRQGSRVEMVDGTTKKKSQPRENIIEDNDLTKMVIQRLARWAKSNSNKLPKKIIVYRDGVSEGQYALVLEKELPSFVAACKKVYGMLPSPKIAIIVVGKRHHTRSYPTSKDHADPNWNTLPGTLVDRGIGGTFLQEFWLQAHQALKGTARPAHYVVIKDDIKFTPNALQRFTHDFCYMFGRANKAVSVCPAVYYADLLATRARCYIKEMNDIGDGTPYNAATAEWKGDIHANISEKTWYL